jgi:hypothetical protein
MIARLRGFFPQEAGLQATCPNGPEERCIHASCLSEVGERTHWPGQIVVYVPAMRLFADGK